MVCALALWGTASAMDAAAAPCPPLSNDATAAAPLARFNHVYAVLDDATAAAVAASPTLADTVGRAAASVQAGDGSAWSGRYLVGRETYVELFSPQGLANAVPGRTGLALSPDRTGGLDEIAGGAHGASSLRTVAGERSRLVDGQVLPWFRTLAPAREADRMVVWLMEYLPEFMATTGRPAPSFDGDVSRRRYNAASGGTGRIRDVTRVEVAATREDVEAAAAVFTMAGLRVSRGVDRICAHDGTTTLVLHASAADDAGLRQVDFALTAYLPGPRVEALGRSVLVVGPGALARWTFEPPR